MSKPESNSDIVIGGITFTPKLVEAISILEIDATEENAKNLIAKNSLLLAAVDIQLYGLDRKFFEYLMHLYNLYCALNNEETIL